MAGRDPKHKGARRGDDWFIDFEQGDLDVEAVARRARQRSRKPDSAKPTGDALPKAAGPSPWVADFLLNQVEGASRMPPAEQRKSAPAAGGKRTKVDKPSDPAMPVSAAAATRDLATAKERVSDWPAEHAAAKAEASGPPPAAIAKARTGKYAPRPFALAATLVLGVAGGLMALPEGYRGNTPPAERAARSERTPQALRPDEPREPWRDLPGRAAALVPPEAITQAQMPLASTTLGERSAEATAVVGAPSVTSLAPSPAVAEALPPGHTVQVARLSVPSLTPLGAPVEVTARDVDEIHAAASPSSAKDDGHGMPADPGVESGPMTASSPTEAAATVVQAPKVRLTRNRFRVVRREDRRRQAVRSSPSRVAHTAQNRSFALPAVLRPTSF